MGFFSGILLHLVHFPSQDHYFTSVQLCHLTNSTHFSSYISNNLLEMHFKLFNSCFLAIWLIGLRIEFQLAHHGLQSLAKSHCLLCNLSPPITFSSRHPTQTTWNYFRTLDTTRFILLSKQPILSGTLFIWLNPNVSHGTGLESLICIPALCACSYGTCHTCNGHPRHGFCTGT
jgi:hypothetical protein